MTAKGGDRMADESLGKQKYLFFEDRANAKSMAGSKHYHNVFELYFMEQGDCHYFIDDKLYQVLEGDLVLIPEGTLHKTVYTDTPRARTLINCSRHYIPAAVADRLPTLYHLYRNPALVPRIRALLAEIRAEYQHPDAYSESVLEGLLHRLFYTLVRNAEGCCSLSPLPGCIEQATAYIKAHFGEAITLSQVARLVSVSPEHLSRLFKRETGFGFSEYLTMLRLQRAQAMLKSNSDRRIADVAFACGFNDSNYFSEKFKQVYGFPPSKLRASASKRRQKK